MKKILLRKESALLCSGDGSSGIHSEVKTQKILLRKESALLCSGDGSSGIAN